MIKIMKQIRDILTLQLEKLSLELDSYKDKNTMKQFNEETGSKFNDIINRYPISEETLLYICKEFAEFNAITRVESIKDYLFIDWVNKTPRLPFMINRMIDDPTYCKFKGYRCVGRNKNCDDCRFRQDILDKTLNINSMNL